MTSPTTEERWNEALPLDFARIQKLHSLRLIEPDLEYMCKIDIGQVSQEHDVERIRTVLSTMQHGLRQAMVDRETAAAAKTRAEQLLVELQSRRPEIPPGLGPGGGPAATADALRARDQHILYLQYEIGQRDLQIQQFQEQLQQAQERAEGLEKDKTSLEEEVRDFKEQVTRARDENDQLRLSIDSQLKQSGDQQDRSERWSAQNQQLMKAIDETAALAIENQRLKGSCRQLESELRDATVQIDAATAEFLLLKRRAEVSDRIVEEVRNENVELMNNLAKANAEMAGRAFIPVGSLEASNAEAQLDQLVSVVNSRVDEWKDLMSRQYEPPYPNDRNSDIPDQSFIEQDLRRALIIRNQEINALRRSLSEAVFEMEEGAKTIIMLKEASRRRPPPEQADQLEAQLSSRNREMTTLLKRTLALEDNLNEANQENKELLLELRRYEQGIYGLPEARRDLKDVQRQLKNRDKYIGDLVQRLNTLTTDYDEALSELSEYRNELGDNVRPEQLRRRHEDYMNSLLDNRVLLKILEDQIARLEGECAALRNIASSLRSNGEDEGAVRDSQLPPGGGSSPRNVRNVNDPSSRVVGEEIEALREENLQLENGMREILEAIKESRVRGRFGQSVELRSPALERLLSSMEKRRRLASDNSLESQKRLDSAFSEAGASHSSFAADGLQKKLERIYQVLEDNRERAFAKLTAGSQRTVNLPNRITVLANRYSQDIVQFGLENDASGLQEALRNLEDEMRAAADSIASEYGKSIFDNLESNPRDLREESEALERQLKDVQEELFKTKVLLTESRTQVAIWNSGTQTSRGVSRRSSEVDNRPSSSGDRLPDQLRDKDERISKLSDDIASLTEDNSRLRSQLMSAAEKSGSTFSQSLTTLEQDHRREIQILSQINKDLRADTQRREEHLENLRASLKLTNQELFDLAVELKAIQDRSSEVKGATDGTREGTEDKETVTAPQDISEGNRQRVVALMETRIQRLENQLKDREGSFQKERNELTELLNNASRTPKNDPQITIELRTVKGRLNESEAKLEAMKHQLELTRTELQTTTERHAKREEELQRDRESVEASYENMVKNLREELAKVKQSRSQPQNAGAAPDSGRTFSLPGGAAVTTVTPSPVGNISSLVKNLTEQLQEKESEIRRLSVAFQAFKDEMLKMPASDQTLIGQLAEQKHGLQDQIDKLRETNSKLTNQLRKEKANSERLEKEAEEATAEIRKNEEKRRKQEKINSEMASRIASLEDELGQRRSKSTDDAKESRLRSKVAELEKALAKAQSNEPKTSTAKPEVAQWEEKKKWEKIVQNLKVKLKEKDDASAAQSTMLNNVKEALARSEHDRGLMDKKLASLSKRVNDLSQKPEYLQQSLAESHKEVRRSCDYHFPTASFIWTFFPGFQLELRSCNR
ncbi:hypothetical protein RvY_18565-2 [Ramazzottius varieornatus]|uniref:Centrosomal protein of 290kDa coiled-coil region domain-containing protein n=1 Tax=Ramazzottius varieornatus TaxID=947166 RepID=A0A1D1W9H0_RAMVA|nr:hypothetical protein RvY_18565-2 [Ramazzottius varieornatus]